MTEERAEKLRKKYESKAQIAGPGGFRGGPGPGHGPGRGRMPGGKPQDVKKALGRLWLYLAKDWPKLIVVFFCVILTTIANLIGSYMLRPIINNLLDNKGLEVLVRGLVTMACVFGVGILCQYLQQRIMIGISQKALQQLRDDLFTKIEKLPIRFFDTNNHGDIMSRFTNDVDAVGEMMNNTVVQIISASISVVGTFCLMVYTNIWLTLVTLLMIPLMVMAGQALAKRSRKYYKAQQAALGILNGYIEETVTGQKVVKVFCHEDVAEEEFAYLNHDLRDKQVKAQFIGGLMGPVVGNISQIGYSLTAAIGGILCVTSGFDIGGLTIFVGYSRQFSRPINELSMQVNTIFSALAGAERVFDLMNREPEPEETGLVYHIETVEGREVYVPSGQIRQDESEDEYRQEEDVNQTSQKEDGEQTNQAGDSDRTESGDSVNLAASGTEQLLTQENSELLKNDDIQENEDLQEVKGAITLSHVTFGYNPDTVILKDVSLYAKPGQKIALVGSTGAGKTTVTNLVNRFYEINDGEITIDGINIRQIAREDLRSHIAMVLQDTHLFTGTVRDNIRYGRLDATDEEVEQAARTASAHSFIMRLEHGYDTLIEGDGANLSQGQRQLLNIARAAISKAPILILDEATSSVDTRTEKHLEHGMDRLMATRTTLVIAHRLSTVRNANAIIVLEHGEVIERGNHDELLALKGRYYNLYTGLAQLE
jgi:ATP-binding cassette subfamily B protein